MLSVATTVLPVAGLDILLLSVAAAGAWLLWRVRRGALAWSRAGVLLLCGAATAWLAFQVLWGWHYQAPTLEARLLGGVAAPAGTVHTSTDAAADARAARARVVATHAVTRLNTLHPSTRLAGSGVHDLPDDGLAAAFREVVSDLGLGWEPVLPPPRHTVVDRYFRWAGIDGLTNPFGLEVILNSRLLPVERPYVLAHEWAHLAGFADESDASFVAWMAGVRAGGRHEYAAWLGVVGHLAAALAPAERQAVVGWLGEGPRDDLRAIAARGAERWPAVQEVAWRVYDRFLKAQRVSEGVARYDAVTRMILGAADERTGRLREPATRSRRAVPAP